MVVGFHLSRIDAAVYGAGSGLLGLAGGERSRGGEHRKRIVARAREGARPHIVNADVVFVCEHQQVCQSVVGAVAVYVMDFVRSVALFEI